MEADLSVWDKQLAFLSVETGLDLTLDANAALAVTFDDAHEVLFQADGESMTFSATVGAPPDFAREEILAALLAANNPRGTLFGACLSLNESRENVVLSRRVPVGVAPPLFLGEVERFVASLVEWKKRLGDF